MTSLRRSSLRFPAPPRAILALFGGIALLAVLGGYDAIVTDTHAIDLQAELAEGFTVPPVFSGGLLLAAAVFALLLARGESSDVPRWVWAGFSLLFMEMALDETVSIHEHLGTATGIDWMVLYTPVFLAAVVLWLMVLRSLRDRPELILWLGGAAAWAVSQMLEVYAYGGRPDDDARAGAGVTGAVEELLEMVGSMLLLWTVLSVYRHVRGPASEVTARTAGGRYQGGETVPVPAQVVLTES